MKLRKVFGYLGPIALLILLAAAPAPAGQIVVPDCISGTSTAELVNDSLGDWKYTFTVQWGPVAHGLSHLDLLLGFAGCSCACDAFSFGAPDSAGTSNGESSDKDGDDADTCRVRYQAQYECHGDPSIPGEEGPLVKWEPASQGCEPGKSGSGVFCFYSDWPPTAASEANQYLLFKFGSDSCAGHLTGMIPNCQCETSTESTSWGSVKSRFR